MFMDVEVHTLTPIDDLYRDGNYLKTVLVPGLSTEKAETNSQIFIELLIETLDGREIFKSSAMMDNVAALIDSQKGFIERKRKE